MIQGVPGVVSCDCENLEFFLNLCLVLKQFKTLELFVHRCRLLPPQEPITMVAVNLKITFSSGEWEKGATIKDNVIIVEKVGIWPMCALLNIKLQQKRTKRKREK